MTILDNIYKYGVTGKERPMFARLKKTGHYEYLQIVENRREGKKTIQRVVATIGRMDQLRARGEIEGLARSLSRFSEKVLMVLSGRSDGIHAEAKKIGPALVFDRLWKELGIVRTLGRLLSDRKFGFDVERAIFLTVLHRLFVSGSDRSSDKWHWDYVINGINGLSPHYLYRAMAFPGEEIEDQRDRAPSRHTARRISSKRICLPCAYPIFKEQFVVPRIFL